MTHTGRAILIVDDDRDTCTNMSDILIDRGYRVDTACDGPAALRLVERAAYDLALYDLRMPGMDGLTLCRKVGRLRPTMTSMLITGYWDERIPDAAKAAGIRRVLLKPLDVPRLLVAIEQALAG